MRNNFKKVCAVVLCIGILSLAAPGAYAIQKQSPKLNLFKSFQKQFVSVVTMFTKLPVLDLLSTNPTRERFVTDNPKIKPTGQIDIGRVSGAD